MGSGGGQSTTQTTNSEPWTAQQPYLKKGFSEASRIYNQGPAEYYPDQTYADISDPTQQGLDLAQQTANSSSVPGDASNYLSSVLKGDYLGSNPYLDDTYAAASRRVTEDFNNNVAPGLAAQFGAAGGAGDTGHELFAAEAGKGLSNSLSDLAANIYGGAYQQERGLQNEALGLAPSIGELSYLPSEKLRDVGSRLEEQQTREIEDSINRWNYEENKQLASLQDYLAMISGNYGGTSVSRGNTSGGSGGGLQTAIGAAATIASMFSDKRLKIIHKHLATTPEGIKIYSFSYVFAPHTVTVGVIAQEVREIRPDVVGESKGYLTVDYGRLFGEQN